MAPRRGGGMVDVVLEDDGSGTGDGEQRPSRRPPAEILRRVCRSLRRHSRTVVALGAGLTLVVGSAGVSRFAEDLRRAHDHSARLEALDGALLTVPTTFSALWTSPSDLFSRLVTATDGLLVLLADDRRSVSALDADSGVQVWQRDLPDGEAFDTCAAPTPPGDSFACLVARDGSSSMTLAAVDVSDGSELARFDVPAPAASYLVATDGSDVLLVSTTPDGAGTVTRRSPLDGAVRWAATVAAPKARPYGSSGLGSSVQGGVVQLNGLLDATLDLATGAPVVNPTTGAPVVDLAGGSADSYSYIESRALPDGGVALYQSGFAPDSDLGVVRDANGSIRFALVAPPLAPRPDDGSVPGLLLLSTGLSVDAVDALTGESRWHTEISGSGIGGAIRYDGALDLVGADDATTTVEQHDLRTGDLVWSTLWEGVMFPQVILAGDSLLIQGASAEKATSEGFQGGLDRLAVVDLRDGMLRELPWPADLPTGSWLMVLDHRLYGAAANQDGIVRLD